MAPASMIRSKINAFLAWLEHRTHYVPIAIAFLAGIITSQPFTYYIVFSVLALGPALLGMPDPIGEFVDYVGREQTRKKKRIYETNIVERHGITFLRQVNEQPADELRLMADCIKTKRIGFNRAANDDLVRRLLSRGLAYQQNGYTAAGYPFYFHDQSWILMNQLRRAIFEAHDKIATPPVTPPETPPQTFSILVFSAGIGLGLLRLVALLLIGLGFGGITWAIWVLLIAFTVSAMVWGGRLLGAIIGM